MLSNVHRRKVMAALAESSIEVKAIAGVVQCSVQTVHRWIRRSQTTGDMHDRPRTGRPCLYSEEERHRLIGFYCQTQPLPNSGRWSLRWAARRLMEDSMSAGVAPSKSTLHRILQSNRLKPHRSRYFLHITDPDFFPKMEHLIDLYKNPPSHLFFFDECPNIQILKRLVPDLQSDGMRQRLEEFEYIRNGTLDLFAFLHHADGKVDLECHADHTADTFTGAFRRHVDQFPETEPLHYVMDNLPTHRCYLFCQLVAELSGISCPPERDLSNQSKRMKWLSRDDKRIVIHFTPCHGSWLNLVEFWFGIVGSKVLRESFASPDQLKQALHAFADDWNLLLAHPFRWTYNGEGLHDKAVRRFVAVLHTSIRMLEIRTLTKQLRLVTNMLEDYFAEVAHDSWHQLAAAISLHSTALAELINREPGPRRRENAQNALDDLIAALQQHDLSPRTLAA
jgi:transposase